jgi:adenylate cyclase
VLNIDQVIGAVIKLARAFIARPLCHRVGGRHFLLRPGYATLGRIGSKEQFHYAAIGSVANLASRLCDEARSGQILITEPVYAKVDQFTEVQHIGDVSFKGFPKPVPVLEVVALKDDPSAYALLES